MRHGSGPSACGEGRSEFGGVLGVSGHPKEGGVAAPNTQAAAAVWEPTAAAGGLAASLAGVLAAGAGARTLGEEALRRHSGLCGGRPLGA